MRAWPLCRAENSAAVVSHSSSFVRAVTGFSAANWCKVTSIIFAELPPGMVNTTPLSCMPRYCVNSASFATASSAPSVTSTTIMSKSIILSKSWPVTSLARGLTEIFNSRARPRRRVSVSFIEPPSEARATSLPRCVSFRLAASLAARVVRPEPDGPTTKITLLVRISSARGRVKSSASISRKLVTPAS